MDKKNKVNKYISIYKIGGTTYKVETAFDGTETLNNKIIRLMLAEKCALPEKIDSKKLQKTE